MEWSEKIRCIESELGITEDRGRLARILGIRPGIISDIKTGKSKKPNASIPLLLITMLGVNPEWLNNEEQPVFTNKEWIKRQPHYINSLCKKADKTALKTLPGIPLVFEGDKEFEGGIVIPVLEDNPVSAGHGASIGEDELPTRYIHAPPELAKYPHLMSLPVKGDSMNPTLNDGDMVVCDGGGWDGDGVYVIKTVEETFVKRVQHKSDGYRIVSDNKMYESYTESTEKVAIVGKVRAAVVMMSGKKSGV